MVTLKTIANNKGTIKNHTTINKQFMADLNIPPGAMRDLTTPTMMLGLDGTSMISPVKRSPATQRDHAQTQEAGLAASSQLTTITPS